MANTVYIVRNYSDEMACRDEFIKVFSTKESARECLKKMVEETYECAWEDVPETIMLGEFDTFSEDYVCIGYFGNPYTYWVVEEEVVYD